MGKIIDNYELKSEIGAGVYAKVYRGINIKTQEEVAIKVIPTQKFKEVPKLEQCTSNEIKALTELPPCPYIVKYIDMLKTSNNYYFIYEYCNGGNLDRLIKNEGMLSERKAVALLRQLFQAFKVLSKAHIMHRDLKPDNILLHNGNVKIADFGFCKPLQNQNDLVCTMLGSPIYMAPQILKGQTYTMKADIWSLGVVAYQLVYGKCPFQSKSIVKLINILDFQQLIIPPQPKISHTMETLIRQMLVKDPHRRIQWEHLFRYTLTEQGDIYPPQTNKAPFNNTFSNIQFNQYSTFSMHPTTLTNSNYSSITQFNNSNLISSVNTNILTNPITNLTNQNVNIAFTPPFNAPYENNHLINMQKNQTQIKNHTIQISPPSFQHTNGMYQYNDNQRNLLQNQSNFQQNKERTNSPHHQDINPPAYSMKKPTFKNEDKQRKSMDKKIETNIQQKNLLSTNRGNNLEQMREMNGSNLSTNEKSQENSARSKSNRPSTFKDTIHVPKQHFVEDLVKKHSKLIYLNQIILSCIRMNKVQFTKVGNVLLQEMQNQLKNSYEIIKKESEIYYNQEIKEFKNILEEQLTKCRLVKKQYGNQEDKNKIIKLLLEKASEIEKQEQINLIISILQYLIDGLLQKKQNQPLGKIPKETLLRKFKNLILKYERKLSANNI